MRTIALTAKKALKKIGIYRYLYSTFFWSVASIARLKNRYNTVFRKTCPILLYHRICTVSDDPIKLCVTEQTFEDHMRYLKEHYNVIPLSELSSRLINGRTIGNEVAITFDDGYQDNLTNALPILEKYNLPATIFITTKSLGTTGNFDWDRCYAGHDRAIYLSPDEIKMISKHRLIEIGGHTHSHVRLSDLRIEEQRIEIQTGKTMLEGMIGSKVTSFAYPFGRVNDYNNDTRKVMAENGFIYAYSNTDVLATQTQRQFDIPRINIRNYDLNEFIKKIFGRKALK